MMAQSQKLFEQMAKEGGEVVGMYWTLGRYDTVVITDGPDEKSAAKSLIRWGDIVSTETVSREEALKLFE